LNAVVVASEPMDLCIVVGTLFVIGGVAMVNAPFGQRHLFVRSNPETN
jgi:hypothetical protein